MRRAPTATPCIGTARAAGTATTATADTRSGSAAIDAGGGGRPGGRSALRVVAEVGREPALDLRERRAAPRRVVDDLVAAEPPDGEVARARVREVEAGDARRGPHRAALGEPDAL